jgi:hypothetical protein
LTAFRLAKALEAIIGQDRVPLRHTRPTLPDEFPFAVETWNADGSLWRKEARCRNLLVSHAAFASAKENCKGFRLTLRNGIRVIEEELPRDKDSASDTP